MSNHILKNRSLLIILVSLVLIAFCFFSLPDFVSAQTTPNTGSQTDTRPVASNIGPLSSIGSTVGNFILYIGSYVTWFGGMLLTTSMQMFVLDIGTYLGSGSIGTSINAIWTVIRDICNLAFIFGFIYVGIRTIIDADSSSTKRMLASIIIGAVLINFSLFFAKVVIDMGNIIAVEIYNTLTTGTGDISAQFADILGVTSLYKLPDPAEFAARTAGANIAYYFMATIMLIVAGFVLAAGAVLLMIRFVALVLILCFSPVLFAATVFPATASVATDLWKKLINYSFFAPAYMLMLLVSIYVLAGVTSALRGTSNLSCALNSENASAACPSTGAFGVVLSFGVAIFFLIMSLQVASKFGVVGGDKAVSFGNSLRGKAQGALGRAAGGATLGLGAKFARATVGRKADEISNRRTLLDAQGKKGLGGFVARQKLKVARAAADSSFDARNVGGVGGKLGIGEGAKGGYQTKLKEVKEKEEKFAKSLGTVEDDDVRVMARKKEMQAEERKLIVAEEELQHERARVAALGADASPSDKDGVVRRREAVEVQKKAIEDAKIKYESEKQRRIIGSTFTDPDDKVHEGALKARIDSVTRKKKGIKEQWDGRAADPTLGIAAIASYASLATEAERAARRATIEGLNKDLEALEEVRDKFMRDNIKDRGYAGVLEGSKFFTAWPVGRMIAHETKTGEEIRETAEKGLPKKKDD